jgi:hypothetical protein
VLDQLFLTRPHQAGAVAAFTVDLLVYPLDTIKTRYQNQGSISGMKQLSSVKQTPYQFTRGLYQGIGSVILATLPAGESRTITPHTPSRLNPVLQPVA